MIVKVIIITLMQNFLRNQKTKTNYNLVSKTLLFLDCICGSTTGGLGLLGLYINEHNVSLINQTLQTLTEYCQGPCHENQNCIGKLLSILSCSSCHLIHYSSIFLFVLYFHYIYDTVSKRYKNYFLGCPNEILRKFIESTGNYR